MESQADFFSKFLAWINDPRIITVFVLIFTTMLLGYVVSRVLHRLASRLESSKNVWDDAALRSVRRPLVFLIWILGIGWAADILSIDAGAEFVAMIDPIRYLSIVAVIALFLVRFIREVEKGFIRKGADITTASAIGRLSRVSVFVTAILTVLQTLGVSISGALAFGGIGGIAVGFAAKDLLANFFGGLMLYLDRPFVVGDWIKSPDRQIEGTVEDIGWRLTIIRTFDQRPLYVPNAVFANIAVENPSRMHNRRIYETIGLRYEDADKLKNVVDAVRNYLANHADIDTGRTLIVNFNSFAPSSLDFFIYAFTKTVDWVEFHHKKEQILLDILKIISNLGAQTAYPTSTLHVSGNFPAIEG